MAETMTYDDCAVIAKCLETAGDILFEEVGYQGGGDNADIYSQVEAHAVDTFGKAEDFNAVSAINKVFDQNPDAYDEYLAVAAEPIGKEGKRRWRTKRASGRSR